MPETTYAPSTSPTWADVAKRVNNADVENFLRGRFDRTLAAEALALLDLVADLGFEIHHDQNWRPAKSSAHRPYPLDFTLDELARPVVIRPANGTRGTLAILVHPATPSSVGIDLGASPYLPWLRAELHACRCDDCQPTPITESPANAQPTPAHPLRRRRLRVHRQLDRSNSTPLPHPSPGGES